MKSCHGIGHGSHTTDYTSYTAELQRTKILPLISPQECEEALNNNYFLPNHSITWTAHASHLCAGGEIDSDTCEGDGGSPLVCAAVLKINEEISAGEGGAGTGTVETTTPDPIFGDFENEYDDEADEVFEDLDEYQEEDTDVFEGYEDYPCDDSEDALGLRESALCKNDGDSELFNQYPDNPETVDNRDDDFDDIRLVQLGVVAWGIGCGKAGFPSVYSSVASARCWLDQVMSCYQPNTGTGDPKTSDSGRM